MNMSNFFVCFQESLFSLTQMIVMLPWSYVSDRFGRKFTYVTSLAGVSIFAACFGLSKTVWQMILFRSLAGVFAGSVVQVVVSCTPNRLLIFSQKYGPDDDR